MKKKIEFSDLKVGQKFKYKRKLYVKDHLACPTNILTGEVPDVNEVPYYALVTPVKIKITIL